VRKRDWVGTVLIACLIAAAGLLHDHKLLLALLLGTALICAGILAANVLGARLPPLGPRQRLAARKRKRARQRAIREAAPDRLTALLRQAEREAADDIALEDVKTFIDSQRHLLPDETQYVIVGRQVSVRPTSEVADKVRLRYIRDAELHQIAVDFYPTAPSWASWK
jgi:hypothetical protein